MDQRIQVLAHNLVNYSMKVKEGEKEVEMSKAFRDMKDRARNKGHAAGRAEELVRLCREFGQSEEDILARLMKDLNLSKDEALQYM